MKAVINQRPDIAQLLFDTDPRTANDVSSTLWTACHYAVHSKQLKTVQLLHNNKGCPLEARDQDGRTPYGLATLFELPHIADYLRAAKIEAIAQAHEAWSEANVDRTGGMDVALDPPEGVVVQGYRPSNERRRKTRATGVEEEEL